MAGVNPYIEKSKFKVARQAFSVTFLPENIKLDISPAEIPFGRTGLPGSLLDIALGAGISVDHACGGVCACSTCHVIVRQGLETCNEATEAELDELDEARGVELQSRLACQCVPDGTKDLVVEIPAWNRNLVKEHD